jgi:tight adherence protein C
MIAAVVAILFGSAAFLIGITLTPQKRVFSATLDELEARGLRKREAAPIRKLDRLLSDDRRGKLRRRLVEAGMYNVTPAQLVAKMIVYAGIGFTVAALLVHAMHPAPSVSLIATALFTLGASQLPNSQIQKARDARKTMVQRTLPDFLDMLATTVEAGLSVNAALTYTVDFIPGALSQELKTALSEMRLGSPRADALKAAADRLQQQQFTTTIIAITQAEKLGTNISKVLYELAEDVRNQRIMAVEEKAAKLPVKMVFPMALFMLPSIFTVIFGALIASYIASNVHH